MLPRTKLLLILLLAFSEFSFVLPLTGYLRPNQIIRPQ